MSGPGVASFHLKLRGGRWATCSDAHFLTRATCSDAQAFLPFPFGSQPPLGGEQPRRLPVGCKSLTIWRGLPQTTCWEVESRFGDPEEACLRPPLGGRVTTIWRHTTADAIQGMREGWSRSARGPSLHVRPEGRQKVWCGDCGAPDTKEVTRQGDGCSRTDCTTSCAAIQ